jgi:hypothetical protein
VSGEWVTSDLSVLADRQQNSIVATLSDGGEHRFLPHSRRAGVHWSVCMTSQVSAGGDSTIQPRVEATGNVQRSLSSRFEDHTGCSDPFRKSCILFHFSITSQIFVLARPDWIRRVLSMELSRFYHSICVSTSDGSKPQSAQRTRVMLLVSYQKQCGPPQPRSRLLNGWLYNTAQEFRSLVVFSSKAALLRSSARPMSAPLHQSIYPCEEVTDG